MPAIILGGFFCYLAFEKYEGLYLESVRGLRRDAEALLLQNDDAGAFQKYQQLSNLLQTANFDTEELRTTAGATRTELDRLTSVIAEAKEVKRREIPEVSRREAEKFAATEQFRNDEFRSWLDKRLYADPAAKKLYHSWFAGLMDMLDRESVTERHRVEYESVSKLFNVEGFSVFVGHYERVLTRFFSPANYQRASFEDEVSAAMEEMRGQIVKEVIASVAAALPRE